MARLIWAEPALQDLDTIADYIALDKPDAAERLVQSVFDSVEKLRRFPKMGALPPELPKQPYRQLVIPPCRIFYRVANDTVYILHVMRGESLLHGEILESRDTQR